MSRSRLLWLELEKDYAMLPQERRRRYERVERGLIAIFVSILMETIA